MSDAAPADPTPMMAQYLEIRARHPGMMLFYRMGDFYELFLDDAEVAARALDIQLTHRGQHGGAPLPMCGVPVERADGYLLTLIRKGFRVAVAEQLEDPAEARAARGSKALVRRDVVRIVTPGTLTEDALLDARAASHIAALAQHRGQAALAWADLSTGRLHVAPVAAADLAGHLARLAPREVLVAQDATGAMRAALGDVGAPVTERPGVAFDGGAGAAKRLAARWGMATLDALGLGGPAEVGALAALLDYLDATQKRDVPLPLPVREAPETAMVIDAATRASLELLRGPSGGRAGSLAETLDRTCTAGGARLWDARIAAPSLDLAEIAARQDAVAALLGAPWLAEELRGALAQAGDLERALGRIGVGRGSPRDLGLVRDALAAARAVGLALGSAGELPARLAEACEAVRRADALGQRLSALLVPRPPGRVGDAEAIAPGAFPDLDAARRLRDEGQTAVAALERTYAEATGLSTLRIRWNGSLGYVVETSAAQGARLMEPPHGSSFRHRQSTGSLRRFGTVELSDLEAAIARAGDEAARIEREALVALESEVWAARDALLAVASALAEVDVAQSVAKVASEGEWVRPEMDSSRAFEAEAGRHPVVEAALRREGKSFVANDCDLTTRPMVLLTGPNMGGKSTYLRQAALLAVLAQAGAWVPARRLRMGLVTRLFSRVGASDDLARGRSTFMVEMVETAVILHRADARSLVLLDEIGRGTSTWDGLSIAWAVLERLAEGLGCRTLFATHYHELAHRAQTLEGARSAHVAVAEWQGDVVFLHEVRDGAAARSYGVEVAKLAGLPAPVVARARQVLKALESRAGARGIGGAGGSLVDDLPLFAAAPDPAPAAESPLEARLAGLDLDALSPRAALETLYELRALLSPPESS